MAARLLGRKSSEATEQALQQKRQRSSTEPGEAKAQPCAACLAESWLPDELRAPVQASSRLCPRLRPA